MKKLLQKSVHTTDSFQILSPFTSCKCCLSIHDALSDPPFFSNPLGLAVDKGRETIYIYIRGDSLSLKRRSIAHIGRVSMHLGLEKQDKKR